MDDLQTILDSLEDRELDYVVARSQETSDAKALKLSGVPKSSFYDWTAERRELLNDYAQRLKRAAKLRAILVIQENAELAARRVVALMDSEDDRVSLNAATDILDRAIGRAAQSINHKHEGESDGGVVIYIPDNGRDQEGDQHE